MKLNTNDSFREIANCMGGSGIIRDDHSCLLHEFFSYEEDGNLLLVEVGASRDLCKWLGEECYICSGLYEVDHIVGG